MTDNNNSNSSKYEALYTELLGRGEQLHESNKRRIRRGLILLVILPFILEFIRSITESDKVVFLIIWIFIMFVVSAYLISIEYLDSAIEKTLRDVTDTEEAFDGLLPITDLRADLHERIQSRLGERRALISPGLFGLTGTDAEEDDMSQDSVSGEENADDAEAEEIREALAEIIESDASLNSDADADDTGLDAHSDDADAELNSEADDADAGSAVKSAERNSDDEGPAAGSEVLSAPEHFTAKHLAAEDAQAANDGAEDIQPKHLAKDAPGKEDEL